MSNELTDFLNNLPSKNSETDLNSSGTHPVSTNFNSFREKLLETLGLPEENRSLFREITEKIKSGEVALKAMRREELKTYNRIFLDMYYLAFFRSSKNKENFPIEYLLYYGYIDALLISKPLQQFIETAFGETDPQRQIFPFCEWLKLIHSGEEEPSINELGLSYDKYIRRKLSRMSRQEQAKWNKIPKEEKDLDRVKHEINNMAATVMRMMTGGESIPYVLSDVVIGNFKNNYVSIDRLSREVNAIREQDFSIFYRETAYHPTSTSTEIVQIEVEPYLIIMPVSGDRVVFWQEAAGKKYSRGRIFVPLFFIGDLRTALIQALGNYRWELCRSSKGALWTDPVEGSLTGAFHDYMLFYKKNSKLSSEAKERIEQIVKNNRKDFKKIFIHYYTIWMENEIKGTMKMDKVARDIFSRYVPFSSAIRKELIRFPAYQGAIERYHTRCKKNITRLQVRYKNRLDENGNLPKILKDNLSFYQK